MALLILAGLQGIPNELYESAKVDGATAWQRFWRITLPLVKPALAVALIFRSLDTLRMYDLPAILTGGANGTSTLSILVVKADPIRYLLRIGAIDDHLRLHLPLRVRVGEALRGQYHAETGAKGEGEVVR
jgi:ABC-type sugar transport systems, permease components